MLKNLIDALAFAAIGKIMCHGTEIVTKEVDQRVISA